MTNTSNNPFSNRAQKALEFLEKGGKFVVRLEQNGFTGREQFHTRLLFEGAVVKGIGSTTKQELSHVLQVIKGSTTISTFYGLPYIHTTDKPQQF